MQEIRAFSTLTVYYDGQFWVGTFEHVEGGKLLSVTLDNPQDFTYRCVYHK